MMTANTQITSEANYSKQIARDGMLLRNGEAIRGKQVIPQRWKRMGQQGRKQRPTGKR